MVLGRDVPAATSYGDRKQHDCSADDGTGPYPAALRRRDKIRNTSAREQSSQGVYDILVQESRQLMKAGRLDEAETQFKRALAQTPNNGWSYFGLAKVYAAKGNAAAAKEAEANLDKTWIGNRSLLKISNL